jgi:CorA-like Mg2+ transporter protein
VDVVYEISALEGRKAASEPFCVTARPEDRRLIGAAVAAFDLPQDVPLDESQAHLHPYAHVENDHIFALAFSALDVSKPLAVQLLAAKGGLLVIAADAALDRVRKDVGAVEGDGRAALAAVLVGLGRTTGEALDDLTGEVPGVAGQAMGFASSRQRAALTEMRANVFVVQQLCAAEEYLLGPDEDLAQGLPNTTVRALRQARAAFADAEATAARLYALTGDVLDQQSALVNERLTLVATVFLPLSVSTSFFGMNFGWMTDHIGTAWTFFGLGVILPLVVTFGTLFVVGRLTQQQSQPDK